MRNGGCPLAGGDEFRGHRDCGVSIQVVLNEGERQMHADRHTGRHPHASVADENPTTVNLCPGIPPAPPSQRSSRPGLGRSPCSLATSSVSISSGSRSATACVECVSSPLVDVTPVRLTTMPPKQADLRGYWNAPVWADAIKRLKALGC